MELLADLPFQEGGLAALEAEQRGYDAFVQAFRRPPVFWGGAGNTWSPEITDALKHLGIQGYVYALTELPDRPVHRFNRVFAFPQHFSISELNWADDARAEARSAQVLGDLASNKQPNPSWTGIFVGHPTKLRHRDFWDSPYNAGRTPPSPEFAEALPEAIYERSKINLRAFLVELRGQAEVMGLDDVLNLPWTFRAPTLAERSYFDERTAQNLRSALGWPIHRPGLSADLIVDKTLALAPTLEISQFEESL